MTKEQKDLDKAIEKFSNSFEPTPLRKLKSTIKQTKKEILNTLKQKIYERKNKPRDEINSKDLQKAIDSNNKSNVEKILIKSLQIDVEEAFNSGKTRNRAENESEINLIYFDNNSVIYSANYLGGYPSAYLMEKNDEGKFATKQDSLTIKERTEISDILKHFNKNEKDNSIKEAENNFSKKDLTKTIRDIKASLDR